MHHSMIQEDSQRLIQENEEAQKVAAAQQDPQAFGVLYDQYAPSIYRYLLSRLGNVEEARDVTSQTFLTAYESFPRYKHNGYFSAWLFSIARSRYVDHLRRNKLLSKALEVPRQDPPPDPLTQVIETERIVELGKRIRVLKEEEQELLRLRYVAGLGFAELASLLNKKEDTVKKSLYRLLARLQSQMEG
jgi:RNA polymerase sigma-70 factor (ECF subfamily)